MYGVAGVEECWEETLRREEMRMEEEADRKEEHREREALGEERTHELLAANAALHDEIEKLGVRERELEEQCALVVERERTRLAEQQCEHGTSLVEQEVQRIELVTQMRAEADYGKAATDEVIRKLQEQLEEMRAASDCEQAVLMQELGSARTEMALHVEEVERREAEHTQRQAASSTRERELGAQLSTLRGQMDGVREEVEKERKREREMTSSEKQVLIVANAEALARAGQVACVAQERLHELGIEKERMSARIIELHQARAAAEKLRDALSAQLLVQTAERHEEQRRHDEEMCMLTERVERLKQLEALNGTLHSQVEALSVDVTRLQHTCDDSQAAWEESEGKRVACEREAEACRKEVEAYQQESAKCRVECQSEIEKRVAEKEREFVCKRDACEKEVEILRGSIVVCEQEYEKKKDECESEYAEKTMQTHEVYEGKRAEWEKEVEALQREVEKLRGHAEPYIKIKDKVYQPVVWVW